MSDNFILQAYLEDVSICDKLIDVFNTSNNKQEGQIGRGVNHKIKESTDVSMAPHELFKHPITQLYMKQLQTVCEAYIKKYPMCNDCAPWAIIESANIQHYKPTQGYHSWHTERVGYTELDSMRHLVFMTYLNDVNDKGETEFYHQKLKVKPRKGLTLIWPADWTHTHRGIASPTENKYIITGWYSYRIK